MSRRREREWEEIVRRHAVGGGENWDTDWEGVAREVGLEAWSIDGSPEDLSNVSERDLRESAKSKFETPDPQRMLLVMVTLKCQRCDRRLDTWRVRCTGWTRTGDGWTPKELSVTSETWAKEIGDSTSRLFEHFDRRPMSFPCVCGVQNIQFSVHRLKATFERLIPDGPVMSAQGDQLVAMPPPRHVTIRG